MNLTHLVPLDIIDKTEKRYRTMKQQPMTAYTPELSRQIQSLAEVLVGEINDALLEIENASDS
jgi:hypothetical protein